MIGTDEIISSRYFWGESKGILFNCIVLLFRKLFCHCSSSMLFKKKAIQKYAAEINIQGNALPVEVVIEPRRGSRFSITRKKIIMRVPMGVSADVVKQELGRLQGWVSDLVVKKPNALAHFVEKEYQTGQVFAVGPRQYLLDIIDEERASHSGKLVGNTIALRLSNQATPKQRHKAIQTLLSRVVASDFYTDIANRVHDINRSTVNKPIKKVYLKHNHSNWGSCSRDGNVNLSTRLLFAPVEVQNYVIVHELAHLVELNHSDRFWALVERYMPDYQVKERWLKDHGGKCNF